MYIHRCQKPGTDRPERQFNKGRIRRRVGERTMRCWTRKSRKEILNGGVQILRDRPYSNIRLTLSSSPSSDSWPPGFLFLFSLSFFLLCFSFLLTSFHESLVSESLKGALCVFCLHMIFIYCVGRVVCEISWKSKRSSGSSSL